MSARRGSNRPLGERVDDEMLEILGRAHELGDRGAALHALRICARCDWQMPAWLAAAVISAYDAWNHCRAATLDEAFGVDRPKKLRTPRGLERARRDELLCLDVYARVGELHARGRAIDPGLFEEVGDALTEELRPDFGPGFSIGKTKTSELYYLGKRWATMPLPPALAAEIDALSVRADDEVGGDFRDSDENGGKT